MTGKMLGACCIALASGGMLRTLLLERRREEELLRRMAAALSTAAREIRWKRQPLPAILSALSEDDRVGHYFEKLTSSLNRKIPLQDAWKEVFMTFPVEKERLLHMDLSGDAQQIESALEQVSQQLYTALELRKQQRPQQTKLSVAAALSAAGGLILLLL